MVGPGTGIAPFRSFWQQRQYDIINKAAPTPRTPDITPESSPLLQRRELAPHSTKLLNLSAGKWGSMLMFFGCRNSEQDCIYKDEMAKAKAEGALKEIYFAFSREPQQPKVRVK